jgi:hypothetical protein
MPALIDEGFQSGSGGPTADSKMHDFRQRLNAIKLKKKDLDDYAGPNGGLQTALGQLQTTFTPYVTSCGINNATAPPGTLDKTVADKVTQITQRLTRYKNEVLNPLAALRRDLLAFLNINGKTQEISRLVEENDRLRKELEEVNDGLSTAYNREAVIDTRGDSVSFHQTWGYLNRPLRRNSIPILIVFSVVFAIVGLVGLYYLSPYASVAVEGMGATSFLQQPAVWLTLAIGLILAGIFITLYFTKQL